MVQLTMKRSIYRWFHDFCSQTSMHGWRFLGDRQAGSGQAIFWAIVITTSLIGLTFLSKDAINNYTTSTIKVEIEDRSAPLTDAFFPSVIICNISPLRKSFIYWLKAGLQQEGEGASTTRLFDLIGLNFFKTSNQATSAEDAALLDRIFSSRFYAKEFGRFLEDRRQERGDNMTTGNHTFSISQNQVFLHGRLQDADPPLPPYTNSTR